MKITTHMAKTMKNVAMNVAAPMAKKSETVARHTMVTTAMAMAAMAMVMAAATMTPTAVMLLLTVTQNTMLAAVLLLLL